MSAYVYNPISGAGMQTSIHACGQSDDGASFVSLIDNFVDPIEASDLFSSLCTSEDIWRREVDDFGPQERLFVRKLCICTHFRFGSTI